MALSNYVRERLSFGFGDRAAADEVADLIDTDGGGALSTRTKRVIRSAFCNMADSKTFIDAIESGAALTAHTESLLGFAIGNRRAATLIRDEKLSKAASVSDTVTITETKSAVKT